MIRWSDHACAAGTLRRPAGALSPEVPAKKLPGIHPGLSSFMHASGKSAWNPPHPPHLRLAPPPEQQNSAFDLKTTLLSGKLDSLFDESSRRDCRC